MPVAKPILVNDIIENHLAAIGGRECLIKISNRIYEGTLKGQGLKGKIRSIAKDPDKYYQLVDFGTRRQETGFDGVTGWKKDQNVFRILAGEELEQARESAARNKLMRYQDPNLFSRILLIGQEQIGGREAYAIEFTNRRGSVVVSYYDAETFLELKNVREVHIKSEKIKMEVFNEDYRMVDGLILPFKVRQITSVNQVEVIIDSYRFNTEIDDQIFKTPPH